VSRFYNSAGGVRALISAYQPVNPPQTDCRGTPTGLELSVVLISMLRPALSLLVLCGLLSCSTSAQTWLPMGPPGGDALAMATDPQHTNRIYLGTPDGHVFGSQDAGGEWKLLGRVSPRIDSVVSTLLVDSRNSQTIFAGSWTRDPNLGDGGGIFRSDDGGITWRASGLAGQAVRAIAQAPSNPDILVAGTLEGVFNSSDFGANWQRISPESNDELHNIDSVAIDPRRPGTIYVGTFHLPWKTPDGGKTWTSIHSGMIDDSDVMSILVDRSNPTRVFASACSGIYRSENGGALWQKVQGIPFSARRTHVLAQDPERASVIYAGTTEGLWQSRDAGATWLRLTPASWIINSVEIPSTKPGRIVIGTAERGILISDDRGQHFTEANDGFFHRRTVALALDPDRASRVLAVLANGPQPLLVTDNGGTNWKPLGKGFAETREQLLRIYAAPNGWWAAMAQGGLMRYQPERELWLREGRLVGDAAAIAASQAKPATRRAPSTAQRRAVSPAAAGGALAWVIHDLAFSDARWFAATDHGLLISDDRAQTWSSLPLGPLQNLPVSSVRVSRDGQSLWAVSLRGLVFSSDSGKTWNWRDLPLDAGGALRLDVAFGPKGAETFVATARKGLYISRDLGATWEQAASGLPQTPVEDMAIVGDVFVVAPTTGVLYISMDSGRNWKRLPGTIAEGSFSAVAAQAGGAAVIAASSDGVYSLSLGPIGSKVAD
jgi:photosystem II stability/assembly factor-like uncharacterized protein